MSLDSLRGALADRYRIERELGQGGMATVYLAHDVRHDRKVALKVLRPELAAILGGERFLAEIKTTANLQHPHILSLFDSGDADGLVYYVMPYVEGESLRDRITREKQLPVDDAVRIALEVADALQYAHEHGIVHRDIKPENILLHGGHAMVADFGIALAASRSEGGTRMTETGMSLGTPHYMAPEQAMGEKEITPKADIYALGCVLYEMLTAEPPFVGATAQAIIARVMTEEPRSLTLQRRTIPQHVESAVVTALAKLPADRFATAGQFAEALTKPELALAATRPRPAAAQPSWKRRALGAAPWLLFLVAAGVGVRGWLRPKPPDEGTNQRPRWTADGRAVTYVARTSGQPVAQIHLRRADGTGSESTLVVLQRSAFDYVVGPDTSRRIVRLGGAPSRDIYLMVHGADSAVPLIATDQFEEVGPALSPDGRWLAYTSNESGRNEVYVRPFPNVNAGRWQVSRSGGREPQWSHTGHELFYRDGALNLVSVPIRPGASFAMDEPRVLFASKDYDDDFTYHGYDVAPGDNRFLFARNTAAAQGAAPVTLVLIENWFAELRQGEAGPRE